MSNENGNHGDGVDEEPTQIFAEAEKPESVDLELSEQKKQNLYLRADFENFKKQAIKERSDLIKYGSEPLLREFLNIYDNLERAASTEVSPETLVSYKNGVEMIVSQFRKTLERFGVEEIDSLKQAFDPSLHEAVASDQQADLPQGAVTNVFKKGFKLHGKVIRPAQVVVNAFTEAKD